MTTRQDIGRLAKELQRCCERGDTERAREISLVLGDWAQEQSPEPGRVWANVRRLMKRSRIFAANHQWWTPDRRRRCWDTLKLSVEHGSWRIDECRVPREAIGGLLECLIQPFIDPVEVRCASYANLAAHAPGMRSGRALSAMHDQAQRDINAQLDALIRRLEEAPQVVVDPNLPRGTVYLTGDAGPAERGLRRSVLVRAEDGEVLWQGEAPDDD